MADVKGFIKKQGVGAYLGIVVAILALVSLIIYVMNGSSEGYFQGLTSTGVVTMSVFAIVFAIGAVVLSQFSFDGLTGRIVKIVCGLLCIGAALLLIASMLDFIGSRAEGLAYIYFSDENVLSEVQTPANLTSAETAITGFILYGITWLVSIVAVFFKIVKD